ncbi:MAG TPA: ElyC/SanA/YdcF family protein [Pyrinomonadaceae bacterium]|nr:ElyC/SanA/YdcF family protein [Pyrinomonadaceae bacterium]
MFLLKKIIGPLLFPLPVCLLMMAAGLVLLWFTRRQRAGKSLVTAGFVLLALFSYSGVSGRLVRTLERSYTPLAAVPADAGVKWVVVLGGGTSFDEGLPVAERVSEGSRARLVAGLALWRQIPGARLVLSGGSVYGSGSDAESMTALASTLGVAGEGVVLDAESPDTESQARNLKRVVGGDPFILVTSASHMHRSVLMFRKEGMEPIPAPTHFVAQDNRGWSPSDFYPTVGALRSAETAAYEYLGLAWAGLRGKV